MLSEPGNPLRDDVPISSKPDRMATRFLKTALMVARRKTGECPMVILDAANLEVSL